MMVPCGHTFPHSTPIHAIHHWQQARTRSRHTPTTSPDTADMHPKRNSICRQLLTTKHTLHILACKPPVETSAGRHLTQSDSVAHMTVTFGAASNPQKTEANALQGVPGMITEAAVASTDSEHVCSHITLMVIPRGAGDQHVVLVGADVAACRCRTTMHTVVC